MRRLFCLPAALAIRRLTRELPCEEIISALCSLRPRRLNKKARGQRDRATAQSGTVKRAWLHVRRFVSSCGALRWVKNVRRRAGAGGRRSRLLE